jgi:hypothetical protein
MEEQSTTKRNRPWAGAAMTGPRLADWAESLRFRDRYSLPVLENEDFAYRAVMSQPQSDEPSIIRN